MRSRLPDGMGSLERTDEGWASSISLPLDEAGAFGRACPDPTCGAYFKVFLEEYAPAREQGRLYCPACGHVGSDEEFATPEQRTRIEAGTKQFLRAAVHEALADFGRARGGRSHRLGPGISIRYTAHHNAPPVPEPLPDYVERDTLRTFRCPNGHRAVIYDVVTVCPYCGPETPPRAVFDDSLAAVGMLLGVADGFSAEDRAAGAHTTILERSLGGVVAALQNHAKRLHADAAGDPPRGNPWQNLDRLRERWRVSFARDPLEGLDVGTIRTLRLAFARRHVIEHSGSVIDARYIEESGEGRVGQRVRLTPTFVRQAVDAAIVLADRLESTAEGHESIDPG